MKKSDELHSCTPIVMQPATFKEASATGSATNSATADLKALALKGLKRNLQCNHDATSTQKECNSAPPKTPLKVAVKLHRDNEPQKQNNSCGKCGCTKYTAAEIWVSHYLPEPSDFEWEHSLVQGWRCDQCGGEFQFIGGSKGPQHIN
jgi:hypothetical protein